MDKPDQRDNKGGYEEHNGLLLDYAVSMGIEVFEGEGLDGQGHESGCEEHAQSVFQGEGVVLFVIVGVMLEMDEIMEDFSEEKFIEYDDAKH